MPTRYPYLTNYEIAGCAAIEKNRVTLWGQQWPTDDPLEQRPTSAFFYFADQPDGKKWAARGIGHATGIPGCVTTAPTRQWIYLLDDGQVYTVSGGHAGFEDAGLEGYYTAVRCLSSQDVVAVGGRGKVDLREAAGVWTVFGSGLPTDLAVAGFRDVDGFGLDEVYAVGGGEAWVCLAGRWQRIELETGLGLKRVVCAADGQVYIAADRDVVFVGRGQQWRQLRNEVTSELHESLVHFEGRVLLSTAHHLLEISQDDIKTAYLPGMPAMKTMSHLGVGADVLVVAGSDEAVMYDGTSWIRILDPAPTGQGTHDGA
jgi:hypothetical protein